MRFETLEEFVDLAGTLNFTQTAARFYITQPALSRHISSLENELGLKLLFRDQRRVRLTEAGRQFERDARRTLDVYHRMLENVERYKSGIEDSISVGYLLGALGRYIPDIHKAFIERFPQVEVRYFTYEFDDIAEPFTEGKIDIAFTGSSNGLIEERYGTELLYTDDYYLVMSEDDELAGRVSIRPEDLIGRNVVVASRSFSSTETDEVRNYLKPVLDRVKIREVVADMNSVPLAIRSEGSVGLGLGHMRDYYGPGLALVPLDGYPVRFKVLAVWKKENKNEYVRAYVGFAKQVVSAARGKA